MGIDGVAVLTKTLKYREENCERKGFSDRWGESEIRIKSGSKVNETCDTKVGDSILLIIYCKMRRKDMLALEGYVPSRDKHSLNTYRFPGPKSK